ncbi:GIY-YIG nuclease family protein [Haloarcula salinisoli]|uniref:GIY-YIG nuclease family protein n=1 Tax=Haloarcula salinisoli TaxID=2487746 RepID=A0A8J7YM58_9EURY|nr:GIY-YIG nuclease family protein [Halomicroarcula salinisoli]MBX0287024.1 GIY-YIG nuclease family protein [Halomicroarcula salinisoli]MBX0304326.1 GIY-YIG nuclease family protein [Halomicroarcula salinisoli]
MTTTRSPDHYAYVVRCSDDTFYTGYTTDVERRVREHDADEGAKYTRGRTPVELVHVERFDSKSAAMSREYEIKQLSRTEKETLVRGDGAETEFSP